MHSFLNLIYPTNGDQQKELFFSSDTYNPQFTYPWEEADAANAYLAKRTKYHDMLQAVIAQDIPRMVQEAEIVYATRIEPSLLKEAEQVVRLPVTVRDTATVATVVAGFEQAIRFLDLPYTVEVSPQHGFTFRPRHTDNRLLISRSADVSYLTVDGAVKHELTHLIRKVNTRHNAIAQDSDYLPTEEGLASYMQDMLEPPDTRARFLHAAQYIATDQACRGSFRSVYNRYICLGLSSDKAWKKTIRQKMGIKDTSQAGSIMKSAMYFGQMHRIMQLADEDRWKLFIGKISLRSFDQYDTYTGLIPLTTLQEFYLRDWNPVS